MSYHQFKRHIDQKGHDQTCCYKDQSFENKIDPGRSMTKESPQNGNKQKANDETYQQYIELTQHDSLESIRARLLVFKTKRVSAHLYKKKKKISHCPAYCNDYDDWNFPFVYDGSTWYY